MRLPTMMMPRRLAVSLGATSLREAQWTGQPVIRVLCDDGGLLWWPMDPKLVDEVLGR